MRAAGMADDTNTPQTNPGSEESGRGRREGGSREGGHREGGQRQGGQSQGGQRDTGGFRIRLSDNELQAARALQEAFGLRSTVAVLGFALRTLAQQLEAGQLQELVAQQRAQVDQRPQASRGGGGAGGGSGDRDGRRSEGRGQAGGGGRTQRIDPFARPSRPAPASTEPPAAELEASEPDGTEPAGTELVGAEPAGAEVTPDEVGSPTLSEQESAAPDQAAGSSGPSANPEAEADAVSPGDA